MLGYIVTPSEPWFENDVSLYDQLDFAILNQDIDKILEMQDGGDKIWGKLGLSPPNSE